MAQLLSILYPNVTKSAHREYLRKKLRFNFKMARVVRLTLAFMEWFFYNLIIRIKLYKIRYLTNLADKALLFPRNQAICLKIENFNELQLSQSLIFLLQFCTRFLLNNVYKRMFEIFLILFRSWVINKNIKSEFIETRSFLIFATQDLNKIKKTANTFS